MASKKKSDERVLLVRPKKNAPKWWPKGGDWATLHGEGFVMGRDEALTVEAEDVEDLKDEWAEEHTGTWEFKEEPKK